VWAEWRQALIIVTADTVLRTFLTNHVRVIGDCLAGHIVDQRGQGRRAVLGEDGQMSDRHGTDDGKVQISRHRVGGNAAGSRDSDVGDFTLYCPVSRDVTGEGNREQGTRVRSAPDQRRHYY
jgi:hypothetical protein